MGFNQLQSIKVGHITQKCVNKYLNSKILENLQEGYFSSLCPGFFLICLNFAHFIIITLMAAYYGRRNTLTEKESKLNSQLASHCNV